MDLIAFQIPEGIRPFWDFFLLFQHKYGIICLLLQRHPCRDILPPPMQSIEAGASRSMAATDQVSTGYPRVPHGS